MVPYPPSYPYMFCEKGLRLYMEYSVCKSPKSAPARHRLCMLLPIVLVFSIDWLVASCYIALNTEGCLMYQWYLILNLLGMRQIPETKLQYYREQFTVHEK